MKVELERITRDGTRSVRLVADEYAQNPATLLQWIKMLRLAERWLRDGKKAKPT
ncbi:hypothetical protein ABIG06_006290 [Bradyrhizobium sp. USDA 326]|uniref:hypothetical protein n=1 Tax=unclassified Bradyrhizobium TaxID=2631580 RepID=UPI0035111EAB